MLAQALAALIGNNGLAIIVARAPGVLRGSDALVVPALLDDLDAGLCRLRGRLPAHLGGRQGPEAGRIGLLVLLQHDVGFEGRADVRLQLDGGQLQQAYGLLQLRCHRQRLAQSKLQGGFKQ